MSGIYTYTTPVIKCSRCGQDRTHSVPKKHQSVKTSERQAYVDQIFEHFNQDKPNSVVYEAHYPLESNTSNPVSKWLKNRDNRGSKADSCILACGTSSTAVRPGNPGTFLYRYGSSHDPRQCLFAITIKCGYYECVALENLAVEHGLDFCRYMLEVEVDREYNYQYTEEGKQKLGDHAHFKTARHAHDVLKLAGMEQNKIEKLVEVTTRVITRFDPYHFEFIFRNMNWDLLVQYEQDICDLHHGSYLYPDLDDYCKKLEAEAHA